MPLTSSIPSLSNDIISLHGVGPLTQKNLTRLGIQQIYQLLFLYPKRYQDYSHIITISACEPNTEVVVCAQIIKISSRKGWKKRRFTITEATVNDDTGKIKVVWYNQPYIAEQLSVGSKVYLAGKITENKYGTLLNNPLYEKVKTDTTHTARIVPMYPLTAGITQKQLRYFSKQAITLLQQHPDQLPDWIPEDIQKKYYLLPLDKALQYLHFPNNETEIEEAKFRLGFEELLVVQLYIALSREERYQETAPLISINETALKQFVRQLPYNLTNSQRQATWDILQDMTTAHPMNRLLEGDVGTGKTLVAAMTMYTVALAGYQSILMAPTELLAQQHYHTIQELLKSTKVSIGLLTANHKIDTEHSDIIIGTHALIQEKIQFSKLALAIIDEQHRFGVIQRKQLKERSGKAKMNPHLLSMTATPIPRSLALTLYGDLSLSLLTDYPQGRKPVATQLMVGKERKNIYEFIDQRIAAKEQIYIVAPRITDEETISETEESTITSVEAQYTLLTKQFPQATIAMLHGKLRPQEKEHIMQQFSQGLIDILIATTVIEVGVNVSNATVIVIENTERFGLAQLHQLRGRVGRSDKQSYCFVCTDSTTKAVQKRLEYFVNTNDGFALAEYDLQLRGPGDVFGHSQSGFLTHFKMADLHNQELIATTQRAAQEILLNLDHYPTIQRRLAKFSQTIHLE